MPEPKEMNEHEELELLCSRALDGELSDAEQARLDSALKADDGLRAFMASLRAAHEDLAELAEIRLDENFREETLASLTPVYQMSPRRLWAVAAAVTLAVGIGVTALLFHEPPPSVGPPGIAEAPPSARVIAFSADQIELRDASGRLLQETRIDEDVAMPAELRAPADAYVVLQLGEGSAVLSPGSRATLARNSDGVPQVTRIDGELYLESWARARVSASLNNVVVSVNSGGATLRSIKGGYSAVPSYGSITVGPRPVDFRERALIGAESIEVDAFESELPEWAIHGRADAIKQHVRTLLGKHYDAITPEQWERGDKLLRGVLAKPAERATHSYSLKILLRHGFFEDVSQAELDAWTQIAAILGEGTTEDDIPPQLLEGLRAIEAKFEQDPERVKQLKGLIRERLERMAERNGD